MSKFYYVQAVRSENGWIVTSLETVPNEPSKYAWVATVSELWVAQHLANTLNIRQLH